MEYIGSDPFAAAVSRDDFKRAVHLTESHDDDDALIDGLILAATGVVEAATNRPMLSREYEFTCPPGDWRRWWFPCAPVSGVTEVAWRDGGEWAALSLDGVRLERAYDEPQLVLPTSYQASALGATEIRVRATCGTDNSALIGPLTQAVILVAKEWLDAGIAVDGAEAARLSFGARALIRQRTYRRPCVARAE